MVRVASMHSPVKVLPYIQEGMHSKNNRSVAAAFGAGFNQHTYSSGGGSHVSQVASWQPEVSLDIRRCWSGPLRSRRDCLPMQEPCCLRGGGWLPD